MQFWAIRNIPLFTTVAISLLLLFYIYSTVPPIESPRSPSPHSQDVDFEKFKSKETPLSCPPSKPQIEYVYIRENANAEENPTKDDFTDNFNRIWEKNSPRSPKLWKNEIEQPPNWEPRDSQRPPKEERKFVSRAVDKAIDEISSKMKDKELAWMFSNCLPNTLDTTVIEFKDNDDPLRIDSFIVTGDISALWLRDSTNQVWPYLRFVDQDLPLRNLIRGLINRQAYSILLDPYANAFELNPTSIGHRGDKTERAQGTFERKYELDSLAAFFRLSVGYFTATRDESIFGDKWDDAVAKVLEVVKLHQTSTGSYSFRRMSEEPSETLLHGVGQPSRRCGLSRSPFRPSDDAAILPYLIPANAMMLTEIRNLLTLDLLPEGLLADANEIEASLTEGMTYFGRISHPYYGVMFPYEVDGFGSHYLADDANILSLLSLPYLGYCLPNDTDYLNTRHFLLSDDNPWFFVGKAAEGIGSPHGKGPDYIWPMSIIMRAMTSTDDQEIEECLEMLKTSSERGFIHESFHKDNPSMFTRKWFAWANTLFGELILHLSETRPHLLF